MYFAPSRYSETTLRLAEMAITSASVCFETRSAVRCRVPVSSERIVGSGMSCTFAHTILVPFEASRIAPSILRELVEHRGRVVHFQLDATRQQEAELFRLPNADQGAGMALDDVVEPLTYRGAWGDHLKGSYEPRFLPGFELCDVVPGIRHEGQFYVNCAFALIGPHLQFVIAGV